MKKLIISLFLVPQIVFAIYGVDDRKDLFEVKDSAIKELAKSVAYQVDKNELKGWTFNRLWTLRTSTLENRRVCSDQRYAKQGAIRAECSGVLVGEDLLLTAGNCITEHYCYNDLYYWVFNYHKISFAISRCGRLLFFIFFCDVSCNCLYCNT